MGNNRMPEMTIPPHIVTVNQAEFSRPVPIESLVPDKVRVEKIEATIGECVALAARFDLKSLSGLKGKLSILRVSEGKIIRIEGDIEADVVQTCVVSLRDVPSEVRAHFDTCFTEEGKEFEQDQDFGIELDEELPDRVVVDGVLDLGELVAQYLSLELDPYPRAPGVSLAAQLAEAGDEVKNRPFKVLEGLKTEKDKS